MEYVSKKLQKLKSRAWIESTFDYRKIINKHILTIESTV